MQLAQINRETAAILATLDACLEAGTLTEAEHLEHVTEFLGAVHARERATGLPLSVHVRACRALVYGPAGTTSVEATYTDVDHDRNRYLVTIPGEAAPRWMHADYVTTYRTR